MRVGIITFSKAINYGAVLQTFALQRNIEKLGVSCEIINYENTLRAKNPNATTTLKSLIIELSQVPKKIGFKQFWKKMKFTEKYDHNTIVKANLLFDCFICGSDQVFNYKLIKDDYNYMLAFVTDPAKKNSYAASFGLKSIDSEHVQKYKKLLSDFRHLSVRETQGSSIVKELLDRECDVVLDPVFLLSPDEWNMLVPNKICTKKYILVYQFSRSDKLSGMVELLAKNNNLEVVVINASFHKNFGKAEYLYGVSPQEFIGLIRNAEFVVTNSFHGVAFSIIFQKQFLVSVADGLKDVASRIESLLNVFGIYNRLTDGIVFDTNPIDYSAVQKTMLIERERSLQYLAAVISDYGSN